MQSSLTSQDILVTEVSQVVLQLPAIIFRFNSDFRCQKVNWRKSIQAVTATFAYLMQVATADNSRTLQKELSHLPAEHKRTSSIPFYFKRQNKTKEAHISINVLN